MLAMGLNYIRFAAAEKPLFRLLFQSDSFQGQGLRQILDLPEMAPVLEVFRQEAGLTLAQAKQVFQAMFLLVHGYASMLANNTMAYDEAGIARTLKMAFLGMTGALQREETDE